MWTSMNVYRIHQTGKSCITKAIEADLYDKFISWSKILLEGFNARELEEVFFLLDKMNTNAQCVIMKLRKNEEKK